MKFVNIRKREQKKKISNREEYCLKKRCIYLFGMKKEMIFCEYCTYRKNKRKDEK